MAALAPGSVFAGYIIERLLGAGGMGEVYAARHPRLPRSDAVKVLAAPLTYDDSYRRRFEREADLAASLSHPGIVSVHDRGEFDGRLWIALQLIDGVDASALLRAAPAGIAVTDVVRAVAEVADALDYAGARGLVHRDVKPANILLAGTGHYLLTDFGIARMGPETSDLTGTGLTVGTVAYASPEQMQGLPVGPRSDQYALAATAFHLLTGVQPFTGTNPVAVIMAHAQQPVPSVRERRPDLSPYVDRVLTRAMAKTPEERFPSSKDFAAALANTLALRPPQSPAGRYVATVVNQSTTVRAPHHRNPPPGSALPEPGATRRRTGVLIAALAAVSVLVVAGVLGVWAFQQDAVAGEAAQLPRRPVTPILPALDTRPGTPVWTLQETPGPPGAETQDTEVLGGDSEIVLVNREVRLAEGTTIDYLDIVDANTGRLRDGTAPIPVDTAQRNLGRCVVVESRAAAACSLQGASVPDDAVVVIDLVAGRIITTIASREHVFDLTAAGDRFVFVDSTDDGWPPTLRSIGADGGELPAISWPDSRPSLEPHHWIDVFGAARLAVIKSAPAPARPLSKWEFRVIRLEDGKEVFRRDSVEEIGADHWNVFVDGFVLAERGSTPEIYDRNGAETGEIAGGWLPSRHLPTAFEKTAAETSVPTVMKMDGNKTTYAGIAPRTGTVLWENESYGAEDSSELLLRGIGTLIITSDSGRVIDAYTGEHVIPGYVPEATPLGTDGNNIAVATETSGAGHSLEVWNASGQAWEITSEYMPVSVGGKVYVGNLRIF
ncbi:serine/threonine protein kinase [Nocardia speluncae]|uniref:non-specific serine/threonine protein kinase n=1 Tax=Nocardia speluncae TaxID=419477 RepID=A0A846XJL4_9NOCA|nr:serine/threonine-protein kinase [Nocardia speluncae]NKY35707.1 serine/threonine protein kinase [Nocardia speluncae]